LQLRDDLSAQCRHDIGPIADARRIRRPLTQLTLQIIDRQHQSGEIVFDRLAG